ncbi:MAG: ABC transporter ATP-binding protein [Bacteroidia bacterium]|nr:ABC transporter ATP-binding protein [Bacteroidia bacterium]
MRIQLENLSKRYQYEWIFRNLNRTLLPHQSYAILGPNGSGKSTLLQVIAGFLTPSGGKIRYFDQGKELTPESIHRYLIIAAPYLELIEEFTLRELLNFHRQFKPFKDQLSSENLIEILKLGKSTHKPVKFFSSGMKQRLKLGLAFYANVPLILLDEPTTNLDATGVAWYQEEINRLLGQKLIIICSNQPAEYAFCEKTIHIHEYK